MMRVYRKVTKGRNKRRRKNNEKQIQRHITRKKKNADVNTLWKINTKKYMTGAGRQVFTAQ